ncbi:MAG TPA: histone deacetylase [Terriglobales bacterium]|nr:histone deacetylase [Terriglobales bacterium]
MTRRLFYTDHQVLPLPPEHRFPIEKYRMLRERLAEDGNFGLEPAPLADLDVIRLVHDAAYVEGFLAGTLGDQAMRRIGFPWSEGLVKRTLASVGSTLAATREALDKGWGGTLAGGTHHAFAAEGSGFCIFNDIAVATRWLQRVNSGNGSGSRVGTRRVAVIDLDVHQGDGTAHIFQGDSSVFTLSVHCKANFPLRKQQSSLDVELEPGVGDEDYLYALEDAVKTVWDFRPEFVFYQSGVDGLASDRLGKLRLTPEGLKERDRVVMWGIKALGVPLVITIGGGYSAPIAFTAEAHANTFRTAAEVLGTR